MGEAAAWAQRTLAAHPVKAEARQSPARHSDWKGGKYGPILSHPKRRARLTHHVLSAGSGGRPGGTQRC